MPFISSERGNEMVFLWPIPSQGAILECHRTVNLDIRPAFEMVMHVLALVGVNIWCRDLDRRREIMDHKPVVEMLVYSVCMNVHVSQALRRHGIFRYFELLLA